MDSEFSECKFELFCCGRWRVASHTLFRFRRRSTHRCWFIFCHGWFAARPLDSPQHWKVCAIFFLIAHRCLYFRNVNWNSLHCFRGKFNIAKMYLHRYLRTIPVFGILILIILSILKHLGDGPYYDFVSKASFVGSCERNWWAAFLHIQNYYCPIDSVRAWQEISAICWKLLLHFSVFKWAGICQLIFSLYEHKSQL